MFIVNLVLTCLTCIFVILSCGGCTPEQIQTAADTVATVHPMIDAAGPVSVGQSWYIYVMLAADIASSVLAGWLAYFKRIPSAELKVTSGNN
jgi:hypothetical protein